MATVYVSPTGNDSNTYAQAQSSATPWLTIGKCNTSATDGDTVVVMAGTHTMASVVFSKSFTIQGATSDPTLYIFSRTGDVYWTCAVTETIKYVTFTGGTNLSTPPTIFTAGGTTTVSNCIFHDIVCSTGSYGGICMGYGNNLGVTTAKIISTNNLFYAITLTGAGPNGIIGGRLVTNGDVTVTGCTFYSNTTSPVSQFIVFTSVATTTLLCKNNIFRDEKAASLDAIAGGTQTISYCCFSGTTNEGGTGSITSDPLFVDAPNANFNLRPTSPCIDTGTLI